MTADFAKLGYKLSALLLTFSSRSANLIVAPVATGGPQVYTTVSVPAVDLRHVEELLTRALGRVRRNSNERHAYKINCNAAIVVLDDGVMVADTHSKPSTARALIEQIKTLTPGGSVTSPS
jgi:hypothetical protein